jgi:hypothetical protein
MANYRCPCDWPSDTAEGNDAHQKECSVAQCYAERERLLLQVGVMRPVVEALIAALAAGDVWSEANKAVDWESEEPNTLKADEAQAVYDAAWVKTEAAVAAYKAQQTEKRKEL